VATTPRNSSALRMSFGSRALHATRQPATITPKASIRNRPEALARPANPFLQPARRDLGTARRGRPQAPRTSGQGRNRSLQPGPMRPQSIESRGARTAFIRKPLRESADACPGSGRRSGPTSIPARPSKSRGDHALAPVRSAVPSRPVRPARAGRRAPWNRTPSDSARPRPGARAPSAGCRRVSRPGGRRPR